MSERGGTGKLRSQWEEKVHIVVKCHPGIPVFDVRREDRTGKSENFAQKYANEM